MVLFVQINIKNINDKFKKRETSEVEMWSRAMAHIWEQGDQKTAIYIDASKNEDGNMAGAYHVGGTNIEEKF